MSDLIARLRARRIKVEVSTFYGVTQDVDQPDQESREAADEIERLQRRVAELEALLGKAE